jgi:hypothetical protein
MRSVVRLQEKKMYRLLPASSILVLFICGCNQQAQVPILHKHNLFHGRYLLEIETVGPLNVSSHMDHRKEGAETIADLSEYEWGGNKLKIDKGVLTFNGKERGTLQAGDRVFIDKNGELSVNGKQRP